MNRGGGRQLRGVSIRLGLLALAVLAAAVYIAGADGRGQAAGEKELSFFIRVIGDEGGKTHPLRDALAGVLPGSRKGTDKNGYVVVQAASSVQAGEYVTFAADKDEWKSVRVKMLVDRDLYIAASRNSSGPGRFINYLLGNKEAVITLMLQPEEDAGPTVNLVVRVEDEDLKPVHKAVVALQGSNPPYRRICCASHTSEGGEVAYPTLPRELIEEGLQVQVHAGRYGSRFSDVPDSVLRGKGPRVFLVVLSGEPELESGTYRADQALGSTHFPSTWKLTVSGNRITGMSTWSCCPGVRHDPLTGTVTGTHVVITRDCTGQGYVGECSQKYTGTLVRSGHVEGTWSDVRGPTGSGTFTLVKT